MVGEVSQQSSERGVLVEKANARRSRIRIRRHRRDARREPRKEDQLNTASVRPCGLA